MNSRAFRSLAPGYDVYASDALLFAPSLIDLGDIEISAHTYHGVISSASTDEWGVFDSRPDLLSIRDDGKFPISNGQ